MSIVELRADGLPWSSTATVIPNRTWPTDKPFSRTSRLERWLPVLTGICLFAIDIALVVLAFLVAYWLRFVAADNELPALGLDQYVRLGAEVGLVTSALFALRGQYETPRHVVWTSRLHTVVSALSTAVVLSLAISFFAGDQAFSRLWLAFSWGDGSSPSPSA